jgi:hypothetical protein
MAGLPRKLIPLPALLLSLMCFAGGCATIRVTDPPRTADEEFLLTDAATRAVNQLSMDPLRGRLVWVVSEYAFSTTQPYDQSFLTNEVRSPTFENAFLIAELRARLLQSGVRLAESRAQAEVILEVRTGALAVNRIDFLLGVPATYIPGATATAGSTNIPLALPELALFKSTRQQGFGSVAFVAYWRNTGELLAISGPFVGRTFRTDYFIFGYALPPVGNIPPTQVGAGGTPNNKSP